MRRADLEPTDSRDGTFTLPQLAALVGVEYRTMHTWLRRGLLVPSRHVANGAGTANLFDELDLLQASVLADLRRVGLELAALERAAQALRRAGRRLAGQGLLVIDEEVTLLRDPSELPEVLVGRPVSLVYSTAHARRRMGAAEPV